MPVPEQERLLQACKSENRCLGAAVVQLHRYIWVFVFECNSLIQSSHTSTEGDTKEYHNATCFNTNVFLMRLIRSLKHYHKFDCLKNISGISVRHTSFASVVHRKNKLKVCYLTQF